MYMYCSIHIYHIYASLCADRRLSHHIHSCLAFDLVPSSFVHDAIGVRDALYIVGESRPPIDAPFLPSSHHPFLSSVLSATVSLANR
ncbi:hypothetical protein BD309DRAFT_965846 [Dichomitus squalens]|nr:hypothetical protein BD309DRAFT_973909 [Dichomitus squalens]TBU41143.1 hypothetical protein BD309DRAFT_965846 [Dichomitus squalens]